tara:strand:- start:94 stop:324 length:231 start_codon:yes stop_codon:yes gene_type:complete
MTNEDDVFKISTVNVSLARMETKLEHIHKDVEKNSTDIVSLKEQVAMGKGGLKAIFIVGTIVGLMLTGLKLFKEIL